MLLATVVLVTTVSPCVEAQALPRRGDANGDGTVQISDPITILSYLFLGGEDDVPCLAALDADDNHRIDLTDAILLLQILFLGDHATLRPLAWCELGCLPGDLNCDGRVTIEEIREILVRRAEGEPTPPPEEVLHWFHLTCAHPGAGAGGAENDTDGDGIQDSCDNCKEDPNPDQTDSDGDTVGDVCDNCPKVPNPDQRDSNLDGIGDDCKFSCPSDLPYGLSTSETLRFGQDDEYCFPVRSGDVIRLRMTSKISEELNPQIDLLDPGGAEIQSISDETSALLEAARLPTGGTYRVRARDAEDAGAGEYDIIVQRLNNPGNAQQLQFGETVLRTLEQRGEYDSYTFVAAPQDRIRIRMTEGSRVEDSLVEPLLEVFDPEGRDVAFQSGSQWAEVEFSAPSAGNYLILTSDVNRDDEGQYALTVERLNNPGNPVPLEFGQTIESSLTVRGETDSYQFNGREGDRVRLWMVEGPAPEDQYVSPQLELFDTSGIRLALISDFASALVESILPRGGTFYVFAGDLGGDAVGAYHLGFERVNDPGNRVEVEFGQALEAVLDSRAEYDGYAFTATAGDRVRLRMVEGPSSTDRIISPHVELYNQLGVRLAWSSDVTEASLEGSLPTNGAYFAFASDIGGDGTGTYAFALERLNGPGNSRELLFGQTIDSTLEARAGYDSYAFTGVPGDLVRLRMVEGPSSADRYISPLLELFDNTGNRLAWTSDNSLALVEVPLPQDPEHPEAAPYFIFASDLGGDALGAYSLALERLNDPGDPTLLAVGQTVSATFEKRAEYDSFRFEGTLGDRLRLRMTEGPSATDRYINPSLELFDAHGSRLDAAVDVSSVAIETTLPESDRFFVFTSDAGGDATGHYTIALERLGDGEDPVTIRIGQTLSGEIGTLGEADVFIFFGEAGLEIALVLAEVSEALDPELELLSPDGTSLGTHSDASEAELRFVVPHTGDYTILARDAGGDDTGQYNLSLTRVPSVDHPTAIAFSEPLDATLDSPSEEDVYFFTALGGDRVRITMVAGTFGLEPVLELLDAAGNRLDLQSGVAYTVMEFSVDTGGVFYVVSSDAGTDDTGDYSISVERLNAPRGVTPINPGQTLPGSLDQRAQYDGYYFQASGRDPHRISVVASASSIEPVVEIFDTAGNAVAVSSESTLAVAEFSPERGGAFLILVSDGRLDDLGEYAISLERLGNPVDPVSLHYGEALHVAFTMPAEYHPYTFVARGGDQIRVSMVEATPAIEPVIEVFDFLGSRVATREEATLAVVEFTVDRGGDFFLLTSDANLDEKGEYTVGVERLNDPGRPAPLAYGETVFDSLESPAQHGAYSFVAGDGDRVRISLVEETPDLEPVLEVFDLAGNIIASGEASTLSVVEFNVDLGGTFFLLVSDAGLDDTGEYTLHITRLSEPPDALALGFGQSLLATFDVMAPYAAYSFVAHAEDRIRVALVETSSPLEPVVEIFDAFGTRIVHAAETSLVQVGLTLERGGVYYVLASDNGLDEVGGYALHLARLNAPSGATLLEPGQTRRGNLVAPGQFVAYRITTAPGELIRLIMVEGDSALEPQLEIFDGKGRRLGHSAGAVVSMLEINSGTGGALFLLASDQLLDDTGEYEITFERPEVGK